MPSYYPSGLLQFVIRLDDGYTPLPPEAVAALQGHTGSATEGSISLEAFAPSSDGFTVVSAVQPDDLTHVRNGPRQADTLSIRITYADLPIPPRAIRSLGVLWYAGTVPGENYASGLRQGLDGRSSAEAVLKGTRSNLRFVGFADSITEDDGGGQLTVECRDYTGVFLDTRVKTAAIADIKTDVPLDTLVLALLRSFPGNAARGLTVEFTPWIGPDGVEEPFPIVSSVYGKQGKARGGKSPRLTASGGGADVSYWDVLTDVCVSCGYLPVIEEDRLRIIPPRTLYTASGTFKRTVVSRGVQETLTRRRLVYGTDIQSLTFKRTFARTAVPSIIVSSTAPGLRRPLTSRWPPPEKLPRGNSATPSGRGAQDRSELVMVRGITTQAELDRVAENLWQEYAQAEYTGKVSTQALASYGGSNADPDLLDLRSGDPVEVVRASPGRTTSVLASFSELQTSLQRQELLRRGGMGATAAKAIADLYDATAGVGSTFRAKAVSQTWRFGQTPSVQITIEVGTYLTVPLAIGPGDAAEPRSATV